ncbi:hypothetical protein [Methylotuvimicrobium alcaliphilum]|uniref:Carrier domain-containing protein n=1 Tax=Methylotuvimicrobium alcaliphilum (strain DSM 19304 / NCIMB 14124 / VKM B-2133 / 20Z) TaxID=1091494 RepID=G4SUN9_META2|nr:hypothetical protein [Methylotuvimicrobium alcaliphilum]CCE22866.1 protein of unknown function [Methylotuvimicrobium alcaliphilum 20Z]
MNKTEILQFMQDYIVNNTTHKDIADIADYRMTELLTSSLDIVYFAVDLEEVLGFEEDTLNIEEWVDKFETITFDKLAEQLEQMVVDIKGANEA